MLTVLQTLLLALFRLQTLRSAALIFVGAMLTACATPRQVLEAVGPAAPSARSEAGSGRLVVFTPQEQTSSGEVTYQQHSSYRVLTLEGQLVQFVRNQSGGRDSQPDVVLLPAGSYVVQASAERLGPVSVPVLVQSLKTTEVHLRPGWKPDLEGRGKSDVIRLPNGQPVGWRAPVRGLESIDEQKAARADAVVRVKLVQAPETMGTAAYALVETLAVLRNNSTHPVAVRFTVGCRDILKAPAAGVSVLYLKLLKREGGTQEWFLLDD